MRKLADISQFESLMNTKTLHTNNSALDKIKGVWRWVQERQENRVVHDVHEMMKDGISPTQHLLRKIGMGFLWLNLPFAFYNRVNEMYDAREFIDDIKTCINRCESTEELKLLKDMVFETSIACKRPMALVPFFIKRQNELEQKNNLSNEANRDDTGYPEYNRKTD